MRLGLLCAAATVLTVSAVGTGEAAVTVIGSGLARACYEAAEYKRGLDTALDECTRALNEEALTRRDRAATYVNRGIVRLYDRDMQEAIVDFDTALGIKPDLGEAYVNKGIAMVHLGTNDAQAIDLLTKGIDMNTSRPEIAFYTRGVANELAGNTREAYYDYKKAAELKPSWPKPAEELQRFTVVQK
jgi:tetratricopeptide (TPR) repeat protein